MEETTEEEKKEGEKFHVNRDLIESVGKEDQVSELQDLDIAVYDQTTLEKGILNQVQEAIDEDDKSNKSESSKLRELLEGRDSKKENREDGEVEETPAKVVDKKNPVSNKDGHSVLANLEVYLQNQFKLDARKRKSGFVPKVTKTKYDRVISKPPPPPKEWREKSPPIKRKKVTVPSTGAPPKKKRKPEKLGSMRGRTCQTPGLQPGEVALIDFDDPSGSEYEPPSSDSDDQDKSHSTKPQKKNIPAARRPIPKQDDTEESEWDTSEDESPKSRSKKEMDDGDLNVFTRRMRSISDVSDEEYHQLDHNYKIPKFIWDKLFDYQKEGVKWMWGLHKENCGGILGDEMGLGKTIQLISFLAGLHFTNCKDLVSGFTGLGPCLIVCPTTIMHQWVREFHTWYPYVRVAILHDSGTFTGKSRHHLIKSVHSKTPGILVTSYSGLLQFKETILKLRWHYVVLDEGHKIRNPEAQITDACKSLDSAHRIILSGSPMQNNLRELWSLFDFIIPGKLGSLNVFCASFVVPILQGGYVNASKTQVLTAFKCALALKDTINPFLIRRSKTEVEIDLPNKTEQVLFCKLTDAQREVYKAYLDRIDISEMMRGRSRLFGALVTLRKICNHPDLYTGGPEGDYSLSEKPFLDEEKGKPSEFGYWRRSGKLIVLVTLLQHWSKAKHRVLLFTQGKKMLLILENFIKRSGYKYLKLDGATSIAARQPLIDKFNKDTSYFLMLLTTRVGGLGVNLTGANKVVIFDPDWNPATDTQARERAWRIGQSKEVTIFRLITSGTIEEKIYHRQIFKQFLSNKVLKDPKQRRFFKSNDLMELLTLNETVEGGTNETAAIFAGTGSEIKYDPKALEKPKYSPKDEAKIPSVVFTEEKLAEMKRFAQEMSKRLSQKLVQNDEKEAKEKEAQSNEEKAKEANNDVEMNEGKEDTKSNSPKREESIYGPDGQLMVSASDLKSQPEKATHLLSESTDKSNDHSTNTLLSKSMDSGVESLPEESAKKNNEGTDVVSDGKKKKVISPSKANVEQSPTKATSKDNTKGAGADDSPKKKKKKRKFAKFEGQEVPHLVKCRPVKKRKDDEDQANNFKCKDEYILHKLLQKSGIETAMTHDTIMEVGPSDYTIVEEEASRVAQEALKAIRQSPSSSRLQPRSEPTNPLTAEIMNRIKARNLQLSGGVADEGLLRDMIIWLNSNGGTASTSRLVSEFREKVEASKSPVFKNLLQNIATFYRGLDGLGYWTIKDEFR